METDDENTTWKIVMTPHDKKEIIIRRILEVTKEVEEGKLERRMFTI